MIELKNKRNRETCHRVFVNLLPFEQNKMGKRKKNLKKREGNIVRFVYSSCYFRLDCVPMFNECKVFRQYIFFHLIHSYMCVCHVSFQKTFQNKCMYLCVCVCVQQVSIQNVRPRLCE